MPTTRTYTQDMELMEAATSLRDSAWRLHSEAIRLQEDASEFASRVAARIDSHGTTLYFDRLGPKPGRPGKWVHAVDGKWVMPTDGSEGSPTQIMKVEEWLALEVAPKA